MLKLLLCLKQLSAEETVSDQRRLINIGTFFEQFEQTAIPAGVVLQVTHNRTVLQTSHCVSSIGII